MRCNALNRIQISGQPVTLYPNSLLDLSMHEQLVNTHSENTNVIKISKMHKFCKIGFPFYCMETIYRVNFPNTTINSRKTVFT